MLAESWQLLKRIVPSQKERRSLSSFPSSPEGCTCSNTSKYLLTIRQLSAFVQSFTCLNARLDGLNSWPILILHPAHLGQQEFRWSSNKTINPWAKLGSLEFSLDMHPNEARLISEGYTEDPQLSLIISRLQSTSARDSFRGKYFWDEEGERLCLVDSSPPRLCIAKEPVRLSLLRKNQDCVSAGHPGRDKTFWNRNQNIFIGQEWASQSRTCKPATPSKDSSPHEQNPDICNCYRHQPYHWKV